MKKISTISVPVARVLLGLVFFVFGLNGFLQFIPMEPPQGAAGQFMGGLFATGYFFPLLKGTEVTVGVLLLSGRLVPLALILLAPITVNIAAFHLFLEPGGLPMAVLIGLIQLYLAWSYRDAFAGVLRFNAVPVTKSAGEKRSRGGVPDALEGAS
jgi:uncharacterized membrane protein YphA (DoxX/SURF4 family)